jgi:hypothetical protein
MKLRRLYGGTNRPQHLRLSRHLALALTLGLLFYAPPHLALVAGLGCICMEGWATADRDLEPRRKNPSWYWLPYGRMVKHRSRWSHGPLGTLVRLAYGWWWLLWPVYALEPTVAGAFVLGCVVADLGHLALDL